MAFEAALKKFVKLERLTDDQEVNDIVQVFVVVDNVDNDNADKVDHDKEDDSETIIHL